MEETAAKLYNRVEKLADVFRVPQPSDGKALKIGLFRKLSGNSGDVPRSPGEKRSRSDALGLFGAKQRRNAPEARTRFAVATRSGRFSAAKTSASARPVAFDKIF